MNKKNKMRSYRGNPAQSANEGVNNASVIKGDGDAAINASKVSSARTGAKDRSRTQKPLFVVTRKFKSIFASYDEAEQNTQTKRLALDLAVGMSRNLYPDRLRFWMDLRDEANVLLDSKKFEKCCENWGLMPRAVAEHLVVEGKATVNNVLKYGLEAYGEKARMFKDPLYIDKRGLFDDPANE